MNKIIILLTLTICLAYSITACVSEKRINGKCLEEIEVVRIDELNPNYEIVKYRSCIDRKIEFGRRKKK